MEELFESKSNLIKLLELLKDKLNNEIYLSAWTNETYESINFLVKSIYELQIKISKSK